MRVFNSTVCAALLVAVALAAAACGGGSKTTVKTVTTTKTASSSPTSTAVSTSTSTSIGGARRIVHRPSFKSPTGNIGCMLGSGVARCDIGNRRWSPPARPSSCQLDFGQGIEVGTTGRGRFVCAGDTAHDPSAPALDYGTASKVGSFLCISRPTGIACSNTSTNHGFAIGVHGYRLF